MTRQEISFAQWPAAVDQFSRAHRGKQARVTLLDAAGGSQPYATAQPLLGLLDERHGRADEAVTLILGGADTTASHSVATPRRLALAEWNDGYSAELEIESADGRRLVVEVGPAEQLLSPALVTDGIILERPS